LEKKEVIVEEAHKFKSALTTRLVKPSSSASKPTPDDVDKFGLILLGNTGAGKSFLANVVLGEEQFTHQFSVSSVTRDTTCKSIKFGGYDVDVFDIPGLIESDRSKIQRNKTEIQKAFRLCPVSIVCFVFGQTGGRIRDEDIVAFQALDEAYHIHRDSLCFVVNNLPAEEDRKGYEGTAALVIAKLLEIPNPRVCFCSHLQKGDEEGRLRAQSMLYETFLSCVPKKNVEHGEIKLVADEIAKLRTQAEQQQDRLIRELDKHKKELAALQKAHDELKNRPPQTIHHYQQQVQQQRSRRRGCIVQ